MKEIETKILEFDEPSLRRSLKKNGAKYGGKFHMQRYVFDMSNHRKTVTEFVRLRTNGKKSTLTYKFRKGGGLKNTDEVEVEVDDFGRTAEIMKKVWKGERPYFQENKIEKWDYKGCEIAICTWPRIKPYVEVEGKTVKAVNDTIKALGIKGINIGNADVDKVFHRYGIYKAETKDIRF